MNTARSSAFTSREPEKSNCRGAIDWLPPRGPGSVAHAAGASQWLPYALSPFRFLQEYLLIIAQVRGRIHHQFVQPLSVSKTLDSVPYYRVYTSTQRRQRNGYIHDWAGGKESRSRRGNDSFLRARGPVGGAAAPRLWLSSVLRASGQAHLLH